MSTPSHILSSSKQGTMTTFKLYGEITPERLAREQRELDHRHDQLNTTRSAPKSLSLSNRQSNAYDYDDDFDDVLTGSFQSTGR